MEKNIGTFDKIIRVVIALVLATVTYSYGIDWGVWSWVAYAVAILLIVTVMTGYCLPYSLLGINTYRGERERELKREMEVNVVGGKGSGGRRSGGKKGGFGGKVKGEVVEKKVGGKKVKKSKGKKKVKKGKK